MKNRPGLKQYIFAALGVVILVLLDQYTKLLAIAHLKDQSAFVLWNNVFELHYLENRGAAFGIFLGGFKASAAGISGALIFGYIASWIFEPKMKG